MARIIPKNLSELCAAFNNPKINGIILEGGSGSRKTFSVIDFLILASTMRQNLRTNIVKETYNSFKTTLYIDFAKRLTEFQIKNPFSTVKDISSYNLLGMKCNFMGADSPDKFTGRCDILWGNEILDIEQAVWQQAKQRCEMFWIGDFNPKTTDHWVYDLEKRDDVLFIRSTFIDNPYIPEVSKKEILAYEPTLFNINQGTANSYMWKVYGVGERASREGLVHVDPLTREPYYTWIDAMPECESYSYCMDFGFTNSPSAIMKIGNIGLEFYAELLYYLPTPTSNLATDAVRALGKINSIICDTADKYQHNAPGFISEMRNAGIPAFPTRKFDGSVMMCIDLINRARLKLVRNTDLRKEVENRSWMYINGISVNKPVDGFDHALNALGYGLLQDYKHKIFGHNN